MGDITGAKRLLRSVQLGMLLVWESGFHSAVLVAAAHWQRGAEVVGAGQTQRPLTTLFRVKRPETPPGITLQKTFLQLVTLI